jgi:predicted CoA-binding protein
MKSRGYEMTAVNPKLSRFDGDACYPSLAALPEAVDGAVLVIPPPNVLQVLRDAAAAGIRYVWLQPGAESQEAIVLAQELGLNLVYDACVMVEAPKSFAAA